MKQRTERSLVAALSLALLPTLAWAQDSAAPAPTQLAANQTTATAKTPEAAPAKADQTKNQLGRLPSAADLRPNGPVTIGANHAELVQGNSAVYVGNVTLDSDTLKMDGDRLELKRAADGQYTAKVTGAPAHMSHAGSGPDDPPMTAHARTMTYDSSAGVVNLVGDALVTKGDNQTTAENIRYNLRDNTYGADRGDNNRVIMILPSVSNAPGPTPPAATGPGSSAAPIQQTPQTAAPPATTPQPQSGQSPPKP